MWDTVVILKEESHPLPRCPKCDMLVTRRELNVRHKATEMCGRGEERSWKQRWEEEARRSTAMAFQAYRIPLEALSEFN